MTTATHDSALRTRLAILLVVLLGTLSLAFVLPRSGLARQAAITMKLPPDVSFWGLSGAGGGEEVFQHWKGEASKPSDQERQMLAQDTEFEKSNYFRVDPSDGTRLVNLFHGVQASIVLSGHDLNDSIHRPERCLPAQGFKDLRAERRVIRTKAGDVPVSRIRCYTEVKNPQSGQFVLGPGGQPVRFEHVFYYWFVGNHNVTASHYDRTFIDMKDRLMGGFDQRWAYVLVGTGITDSMVAVGFPVGDATFPKGRSEELSDALLEKVVGSISRESIRWTEMHP